MAKSNQNQQLTSTHWADIAADKIIREKGDKESYTFASGITPSGRVHFGNFREAVTVDLVAKALRDRGKKVRQIHSWDNYDTFRKVPKDIEDQEKFETFLFQPIVDVPDPAGIANSYADAFMQAFESELKMLGMSTEFLYQASKYRAGEYKGDILKALEKTKEIKEILNKYRSKPLTDDWLPVSIYCPENKTDQIKSLSWDGARKLSYIHENGFEGELDLDNDHDLSFVKLPWRIDWPMRWAKEQVDFEPGGKDHSSDGGSFTTAQELVKTVYGAEAPVYLQYDFVSIKGGPGKMSSSKGGVVTVTDVLKVYEPEMIKWIFASYKPNVDFALGFDEDVIKNYEAFDRQERLAYGLESGNEKKVAAAKRIYELSQIAEQPETMPFQPAFRHLTTLIQIHDADESKVRAEYQELIKTERDERRFKERFSCAKNWLKDYAPQEFIFKVNIDHIVAALDEPYENFLIELKSVLSANWENYKSDQDLHNAIYECIHKYELQPNEVFPVIYSHLISREKGPRLASFMRIIGKERVLSLL